ncbi:MAG: type II toxin-antitoxin system VapC family toxin [Polyangiaceae bacterium]|nr:type II toxin-antitoxin system VapC family toxin [Polyangiaceae bacterium]
MASADRCYVDPSALRSLYLHDDRSSRFCAWRRRTRGALPVTRFGRAELVNSVQLAVHRGTISADVAALAAADFESDLAEGRLQLVDALWRRMLDLAAELSQEHTAKLGTHTLDVLHVASALALGAQRFVTYDTRQAALAKAVKLRVLAP